MLERIVYDFLVKHLNDNAILYPRQFGFRRNHSTSAAIMNLVGDVLKAMDDKMMLLSVFIDLKKAFDMVPHKLVLEKLNKMGINGLELEWFSSYMHLRKQFVVINDKKSALANTTVGVQQGSLLGVLLFQLMINDLPKCLKFSTSILYANDTTIYV